jgi:hypothetical protein
MDLRLVSLITILFVNFTSFLLLNQYFSLDALDKGVSIRMIGLILSTYPFGNIYASIYIGKNSAFIGKKKLLVICSHALTFSFLIFSLEYFISSKTLYVLFGFLARTI